MAYNLKWPDVKTRIGLCPHEDIRAALLYMVRREASFRRAYRQLVFGEEKDLEEYQQIVFAEAIRGGLK